MGGTLLGVGVSAGITRSNSDLVSIKLHENPSAEGLIRKAQEEQKTIIEGDDAQMYDLRVTDTSSRSMPLLIKDKCLIVPKEFIHLIDSPVVSLFCVVMLRNYNFHHEFLDSP